MSRKQKILVASGLFIILIVSGGFFVNYLLNNMVTTINSPQVDYDLLVANDTDEDVIDGDSRSDGTSRVEGEKPSSPSPNSTSNSNDSLNQDIARDVQNKIGRPIEKKDIIAAGKIIIKNLSLEEINYLYKVGKKDSYTKEELRKTRQILTTNLSAEEIKVLRSLGGKYGKALRVLDVNVEIK